MGVGAQPAQERWLPSPVDEKEVDVVKLKVRKGLLQGLVAARVVTIPRVVCVGQL
jgi:hypothetical protein